MWKICFSPLNVEIVVKLLQNPPQSSISTLPSVKPKAGEVYVYSDGGDDDKKGVCRKLFTSFAATIVRIIKQ